MLVNISSHTSDKWTREQILAGQKLASDGQIVDFEFPFVQPHLDGPVVQRIADELYDRIMLEVSERYNHDLLPEHDCFCLNGEQGLVFYLTKILLAHSYKVYYPTKARVEQIECISNRDRDYRQPNSQRPIFPRFEFASFRQLV